MRTWTIFTLVVVSSALVIGMAMVRYAFIDTTSFFEMKPMVLGDSVTHTESQQQPPLSSQTAATATTTTTTAAGTIPVTGDNNNKYMDDGHDQYRCNGTGMTYLHHKYAVVSFLVDQGAYVSGIITLGRSLQRHLVNKSEVGMYLMILETTRISSSEHLLIHKAGWTLCFVPLIEPKDVSVVFGRFRQQFTKLNLFTWTQFERIVYTDADTLINGDITEMFEPPNTEEANQLSMDGHGKAGDFMACPDYESGHPIKEFNMGVFSLKPNVERFDDFLHQAKTRSDYRVDTAEQGLLRDIYSKLGWVKLPIKYNAPLGMYMFERNRWKAEEAKNNGFSIIHFTEVKPFHLGPQSGEWDWEPMQLWKTAATATAVVIMSTGKYGQLMLKPQVEAIKRLWKTSVTVDIFVWTDNKVFLEEFNKDYKVVAYTHQQQGWPKDTYNRPKVFLEHKDLFKLYTYVYTIDADLMPRKEVTHVVLGDLVGMKHPEQSLLAPEQWVFERRPESEAYIPVGEGKNYFQGCFYGGKSEQVIALWEAVSKAVAKDEAKGIIARVDEESHLNKYMWKNPPTLVVDASYGDPTNGPHFDGIIEHLDKGRYGGHASFRQ